MAGLVTADSKSFTKSKRETSSSEVSNNDQPQSFAINVVKSGTVKFTEDPKIEVDDLEYPRTGTDSGLVVIFNQENFELDFAKRTGTTNDVEQLTLTLGRLKYNIDSSFIFIDLSRREILKAIERICAMDLQDRNCLICIFLSHGDAENTLIARDGTLTVEEVYEPFCKCDHLKQKPKFFLYQACKTNKKLEDISVVDSTKKYDKKLVCDKTIKDNIPRDVLLVYSTIEGEVSMRNHVYGTWFIQELCRNMMAYGRRDDVFSILMRTIKCVANNYCYVDKDNENLKVKQLPIFISTLTKKFYLTKSKERLFLLQVMKELDSLKEEIASLKKAFETSTRNS